MCFAQALPQSSFLWQGWVSRSATLPDMFNIQLQYKLKDTTFYVMKLESRNHEVQKVNVCVRMNVSCFPQSWSHSLVLIFTSTIYVLTIDIIIGLEILLCIRNICTSKSFCNITRCHLNISFEQSSKSQIAFAVCGDRTHDHVVKSHALYHWAKTAWLFLFIVWLYL